MILITHRDRALFEALGKYGLLTTSQLSQKLFAGVQNSTVLRRLRALEDANWIYRIKALESGELVWILTRKGEAQVGVRTPMIKPNRNGVAHDVLLTELRVELDAIGLGQNFVPEWTIRRLTYNRERSERGESIVPDGIFSAVDGQKNLITVAVELEVNGKTSSRYEKVFSRYMDQRRLELVWYFVKTKSFGEALQAKWREISKRRYRIDSGFVFTVLDDLKANHRKANIHLLSGNTVSIEQFFTLPEPAQAAAHAVGTQNLVKALELNIQSENKNKDLPHEPRAQKQSPPPLTSPPLRWREVSAYGLGDGFRGTAAKRREVRDEIEKIQGKTKKDGKKTAKLGESSTRRIIQF